MITVLDRTAPVIAGVPAAETVECSAVPTAATTVTATDNCDDNVTITYAEVRTDGACPDSYTLTRTWTATDDCANAASASQVITVLDRTAPVIAGVPAAETVECSAVPTAATTVTATDNCDDNVTITYAEVRTDGACPDSYTLTLTWTATDDCANAASASQVITVLDRTAPVIAGVPAAETVECSAVPTAATTVTATDNCDDNVTITYAEVRTDGACPDLYTLTLYLDRYRRLRQCSFCFPGDYCP